MLKRQLHKLIKEENGSGLVLALMVLLVLSVLGATVGTVTINSNRLSHSTQDHTSAYYIAEAGANLAYDEIKSYVSEAYEKSTSSQTLFFNKMNAPLGDENTQKTKTYSKEFSSQSSYNPEANVEITESSKIPELTNQKIFTITSTGVIGTNSRTVTKDYIVTWKDNSKNGNFPQIPEGASAIVKNNIKLINGTIKGDIYLDSKEKGSFIMSNAGNIQYDRVYTSYNGNLDDIYKSSNGSNINGNKKTPLAMNYALPWEEYNQAVESIIYPKLNDYPIVPNDTVTKDSNTHHVINNGNILINDYKANGYSLNLDSNRHGNKLEIVSNWVLKVKTYNKTVNLVVNELNIPQGHIEIIDGGTLNLYVLNKINLGGGATINKNGNSNQFNLFYGGSPELVLSGAQTINGGIHISRANLKLTASGNINGPILSNGSNIIIDGGSMNNILIVAPKANISMSGSGTVKGIVLGKELAMEGSPKIEFISYNFDNFPFTSTPVPNVPVVESDLISGEPAFESSN